MTTTTTTPQTANLCQICGDKSVGCNFGVLTCMACKAFFRRNAVRLGTHEFTCPKDGDCPITHIHRRFCNCCRLAKCFRVGMQKDRILSESAKQARRLRVAQNRERKEKAQKVEKSRANPVTDTQHLTHYYGSCLSADDKTLLQNVFNAYESTCITAKQSHYPAFPLRKHTDLFAYLNEYSSTHKVLIEYFKIIPEFQDFSIKDKVYLIRSQFGMVNNINEAIVHPGTSSNLIVSMINVFGTDLAERLLESIRRIEQFTRDPIILKLLLVIIAFTSGNRRHQDSADMDHICASSLTVFAAQNIYVEVLWKYIRSRSDSELDTVKYFNRLVQFLLDLLGLHTAVDGYISDLSQQIEQMEPLMRSMWPSPVNSTSD